MSQEPSGNTFNKGLTTDYDPLTTPSDVLTDALNGTMLTYKGNEYTFQTIEGNVKLINHEGAEVVFPDGFIPIGVKEYNNILYFALYNPITKEGELGSYPSIDGADELKIINEFSFSFNPADLQDNGLYVKTHNLFTSSEYPQGLLFPSGALLGMANTTTQNDILEYYDYKLFSTNESGSLKSYYEESPGGLAPGDIVIPVADVDGNRFDKFKRFKETYPQKLVAQLTAKSLDSVLIEAVQLSNITDFNKKYQITVTVKGTGSVNLTGLDVTFINDGVTLNQYVKVTNSTESTIVKFQVDEIPPLSKAIIEVVPYTRFGRIENRRRIVEITSDQVLVSASLVSVYNNTSTYTIDLVDKETKQRLPANYVDVEMYDVINESVLYSGRKTPTGVDSTFTAPVPIDLPVTDRLYLMTYKFTDNNNQKNYTFYRLINYKELPTRTVNEVETLNSLIETVTVNQPLAASYTPYLSNSTNPVKNVYADFARNTHIVKLLASNIKFKDVSEYKDSDNNWSTMIDDFISEGVSSPGVEVYSANTINNKGEFVTSNGRTFTVGFDQTYIWKMILNADYSSGNGYIRYKDIIQYYPRFRMCSNSEQLLVTVIKNKMTTIVPSDELYPLYGNSLTNVINDGIVDIAPITGPYQSTIKTFSAMLTQETTGGGGELERP